MTTTKHAGALLVLGGVLIASLVQAAPAPPANPHEGHSATTPAPAAALPPLPEKLPAWMSNTKRNHIFYKSGAYNFDIYNIPSLARDLNAVAVGHAMAYEDMVTGRIAALETETYERINWVLKNPPKFMPDEAAISPTFGRRYGVLEMMFDWTHILHAQTVDVLASTKLSAAEKDAEIERLWRYYYDSVPWKITPLPMNMEFLDSQPYSGAFRKKYPKVNGLFWGYHWLQGAMYDLLYRTSLPAQRKAYEVLGERYHKVELYRTDRPFMPMFAELSPEFSARFPHIANVFDNLHMLHDMVNDILAYEGMSEAQRAQQIQRAMWMVSADAHQGEKPGSGSKEAGLHDHRFTEGMPGMGMMKGSTEELMFMPGMGWMSMADCAHCSMPLPEGDEAWRTATVSAEGWSMRVRCALCARDMAAQAKGRAVLRLPSEDPARKLVLISDEEGNLTSDTPGIVFIEFEKGHPTCHEWSRAFTSRAAFDAYIKAHPEYAGAKALSLKEWTEKEGKEPETYVKPQGPVADPYRPSAPKESDEDADSKDEPDEASVAGENRAPAPKGAGE
jgi:hypothetical protein